MVVILLPSAVKMTMPFLGVIESGIIDVVAVVFLEDEGDSEAGSGPECRKAHLSPNLHVPIAKNLHVATTFGGSEVALFAA